MKAAALTAPFSVGLNRMWPRDVIAEIRLMAWRAPFAWTIGVSRCGAVNGGDKMCLAGANFSSSINRAKKTAALLKLSAEKLRLYFLPPYSPDRNPDDLVWKHLKADTAGRGKVRSTMRQLQNDPEKIRSFY
jgi:hypothetical protein